MSCYLDTNIIVAMFIPEPNSAAVADAVVAMEEAPTISDYGAGEFASVISRHVRMGEFDEVVARSILDEFDRWVDTATVLRRVETQDIKRAAQIVRRFELKLRLPDALLVALCENAGLPMMTRDGAMAAAAKALGLKVLKPEC